MLDGQALFSSWLSIWAWGHVKKEPVFVWHDIKQESAVACPSLQLCGQNSALFICPKAKRTHCSIETHLFQLSQPTYGWCYLLWGSCSSYSYRNNGIFLTEPEIWMSDRGWKLPVLLQWCHFTDVYVCVCVCVHYCICKIFMGRQEMGRLLNFLLSLCPKAALCLSFTRTFVRLNHHTVCGLETWFNWKETP